MKKNRDIKKTEERENGQGEIVELTREKYRERQRVVYESMFVKHYNRITAVNGIKTNV